MNKVSIQSTSNVGIQNKLPSFDFNKGSFHIAKQPMNSIKDLNSQNCLVYISFPAMTGHN